MKKVTIFLLVLVGMCFSQPGYQDFVESYKLYFTRLDRNQALPAPNVVIGKDTTLTFGWERGDGTEVPYVTPYTGNLESVITVLNTPEIWGTDTVASAPRMVVLKHGLYEIVVTEVADVDYDGNAEEGGHSQPIFMFVSKARVEIPIHFGNK